MVGIPRALTTDAEDVVWALQTAEALWKRFERADAIVWLRRAAQAAGDAEDDDRALTLANSAAELADWVAQDRDDAATTRPVASPSASAAAEAVDDLLRAARVDDTEPNAPAEDDAKIWRSRKLRPASSQSSPVLTVCPLLPRRTLACSIRGPMATRHRRDPKKPPLVQQEWQALCRQRPNRKESSRARPR